MLVIDWSLKSKIRDELVNSSREIDVYDINSLTRLKFSNIMK